MHRSPAKTTRARCGERIKNAFWELLEENDLKHITVNTVTQKAHCNRGTFYYHYESLDALLCTVIEEELLSSKGLPAWHFYIASATTAKR